MQVCATITAMRAWQAVSVAEGVKIGFVPTMGALHEGHISLVHQARAQIGPRGRVVVSIYVNPTQFGPQEDLQKYPRTLDADLKLLKAAGVDAVFTPSDAMMYPHGREDILAVEPGPLGTVLDGALRPGHFRGVCTVVLKLLNIVQPAQMFMGQKDYQQQLILRAMLRDLDVPVELVTCPTIREADGLALSSRNRYLDATQRGQAIALYAALDWAKGALATPGMTGTKLTEGMHKIIQERGLTVQYASGYHPQTLVAYTGPIDGPCVGLVAAVCGSTRLIDNMPLTANLTPGGEICTPAA